MRQAMPNQVVPRMTVALQVRTTERLPGMVVEVAAAAETLAQVAQGMRGLPEFQEVRGSLLQFQVLPLFTAKAEKAGGISRQKPALTALPIGAMVGMLRTEIVREEAGAVVRAL